jgi:hypothetical protein
MTHRPRIVCDVRKPLALAAAFAATVGLVGCGGGSTKAAPSCFELWNESSNSALQARVANRFRSASVSNWSAQASGSSIDESWTASSASVPPTSGNVGGRASHGCGYLFHTSRRFVSFSAELKGRTVRWNVPPAIHGSWSRRQQVVARDNAAVDGDGLLNLRAAG